MASPCTPGPTHAISAAEDVIALAELTRARGVEFNLEGNPFAPPREGYPGFIELCGRVRPAQATLVPDSDGQITSDHGFDFRRDGDVVAAVDRRAEGAGLSGQPVRRCRSADSIDIAAAIGADRVEFYTGPYAEAYGGNAQAEAVARFADAARRAGGRAGHQRRARPQPGEPGCVSSRSAFGAGSLDRARIDRRGPVRGPRRDR